MAVKKLILAGQPSNGNLELQGMQSLAQELCVKRWAEVASAGLHWLLHSRCSLAKGSPHGSWRTAGQ